jgi:hypothetical protein
VLHNEYPASLCTGTVPAANTFGDVIAVCCESAKFLNVTAGGTVEAANYITLGPALFDNNDRLITLSGGYKNLRYLTQFIVTIFYMEKKTNFVLKTYAMQCCLLLVCI